MTCWLFFHLLTSLKDGLDCSYVEGFLVPLPCRICQYGMSPATSSVGGRDFLPKLWGCFKFSSFTELVQRLTTCWLFFHPFDIFEGQIGLFLCGRTPCAITMPDLSIWNVSRVLTLYQTSPFLACITAFCFSNFLGVQVRQQSILSDEP